MCFSIPYKIIWVDKNSALIEGGKIVKLGKDLKAKKGDYLQIIGEVAIGSLTRFQGLKIRKLIKTLN